jgi:hypothetical protein
LLFHNRKTVMGHPRIRRLVGLLLLAGTLAGTAAAQRPRISTVEGPGVGEKTTLSMFPHAAGAGISLRAIGVQGRDTTRWSLTIIGVREPTVTVRIEADGEVLKTEEVTNPSPRTGPHQVALTKEEFLLLTNAETGRLRVNGTTVPLPEALQLDMKAIFRKVV